MKRILNIFLIITILLAVSCSEDRLQPEALSFYTSDNLYTDATGLESILLSLRKDLNKECMGNRNYICNENAASDLGVPMVQLDFYKLTPNSDRYFKYLSMFTEMYGEIKNANTVISRIDGVEWADEATKNLVLAKAYWYRAYWYYRLVNTYGDVPYVGKEIAEAKLDFYTTSRWAILDKMVSDMEFAVNYLPETTEAGDISKYAGYHLLTKLYLANCQFDKAVASATTVINGPFSLITSRFGADAADPYHNLIWDLHRVYNHDLASNTENILSIVDRYEAPDDAKSAGTYTMRLYSSAWWHSYVKDSEGKNGMVAEGAIYDTLGRGNPDCRINAFYEYELWNEGGYTWENTPDLRRSDSNWYDVDELTYNNPESVDYGKPVDVSLCRDVFQCLSAMPYYITYAEQQNKTARPYGGNGDWYIFRLAETYLLRAEANYWLGNTSAAMSDINIVRDRSHAPLISVGDVTIDYIFDERARELFIEEPRHSELVRASYIMAKNNIDGYSLDNFSDNNYYYDRVMKDNIYYTETVSEMGNVSSIGSFHVLWPIPDDVITANTMGVINQNVGYVGAENNVPALETISDSEEE